MSYPPGAGAGADAVTPPSMPTRTSIPHLRFVALALVLAGCRPLPLVPQSPSLPPAQTDAAPTDAAPIDAVAAAATVPCRSALPFAPAPHEEVTATRPVTALRVMQACDRLARRSRQRAAAFLRPLPSATRAEYFEPLVRCYDAGEGAWTFEVTHAQMNPPEPREGPTVALRARPVFVNADGSTVAAAEEISVTSGTSLRQLETRVDRPRTFDWDGDGRAELYFEVLHAQEENNFSVQRDDRFWVLTARGGLVRESIPEATRAERIVDVDGDGRPDLVLPSPWVVWGPCGVSEVPFPGPERLLHALPDGTFSADDAVAQGFVADQCRTQPGPVLPPRAPSDAAAEDSPRALPPFRLGCARWWGRSAHELTQELERTYPVAHANPDDDHEDVSRFACFPRAELLRAAAIDPPLAFRLRCP